MRAILHSVLALTLVLSANANAAEKKAATKSIAAGALKLDPAASEIHWEGSKKLVKSAHKGTVKLKSGEVQMTGDQPTGGSFEIDMTTIANLDLASSPKDQAKLVGHLNSPDFFDTKKHPTSTFKITSVKALKPTKAGDPTHEITGDLTIKGKTHPKTFPAVVTTAGDKVEANASLAVDRTLYDVRYGSGKFFDNLGDKVINDDIKIDLKLVAKK